MGKKAPSAEQIGERFVAAAPLSSPDPAAGVETRLPSAESTRAPAVNPGLAPSEQPTQIPSQNETLAAPLDS